MYFVIRKNECVTPIGVYVQWTCISSWVSDPWYKEPYNCH